MPLRCDLARAAPLARLVHGKTAGNPFFVVQFLQTLAEEGWLVFNHEHAQWSWDLGSCPRESSTGQRFVDLNGGQVEPPAARDAEGVCSSSPASGTSPRCGRFP